MSNMIASYDRPKDRPHLLWCRVCHNYLPDKWTGNGSKPNNVKLLAGYCCNISGSLIFRYRNDTYKPKCSNLFCLGDCDNLECNPPKNIVKSTISSSALRFGALLTCVAVVFYIVIFFVSFKNDLDKLTTLPLGEPAEMCK